MGETAVTPSVASPLVGDESFDRDVIRRLGRLGWRLRGNAVICGLAWVLTAALSVSAVQLVLDYTFRLPWDMRAAVLGVIVVALAAALWRRVWQPLRFAYGPREMACVIERRHPELHSVLVSAVQFAAGEVGPADANSPQLVGSVVERAGRAASGIAFSEVLDRARPRWGALVIVAVIAVVAFAFRFEPQVMGMWFSRNVLLGSEEWPKRTTLIVEVPGGVLTGARGDDLEVRAHADGVVPRDVDIIFEYESGKRGRETMVRVGERGFRHTFVRVEEPFRFRVKGGDDETEWFEAHLADRPKVEEMRISVVPPEYARLDAYTLPAGQRAVETLLGSRVTVAVRLNKPVVRADLMSGQEMVADPTGSDDAWTVTLHARLASPAVPGGDPL
ncbi:MAG: hypothetical protein IID39_09175, partial [Planctomycetes bacterium]|nr:hypothetical protein [Planctomycetota bacterium]